MTMTRTRSFDFAPAAWLALALLGATLAFAAPSWAQQGDNVVSQARTDGLVGEQADGYLGVVAGAQISADLRGRVDQINIRRRALYTSRATERNASVNEMAAAVACEIFEGRIAVGERYRNEAGQWRQHTASQPVALPSFCSPS
jgi:uncharacterized protein YdbL (DUF1318 family)